MHEVGETYRQAPERHAQGIHTVSIDEKTSRQALERLHPTRELKPGLIERWEYEYARHGQYRRHLDGVNCMVNPP